MIEGVVLHELKTNLDERGYFREIIRVNDPFFAEGFGQWSHSLMYTGVAKAWHIHQKQIDWWYVPVGVLKVALHDCRESSPTYRKTQEFFLGENQKSMIVKIPQNVAHGCRCIQGPSHLFYITSFIYNPADEGRIPHDDKTIGYDWTKLPPIK